MDPFIRRFETVSTVILLRLLRGGMGIFERVRLKLGENEKINLAGRVFEIALTKKAYSYFKYLYRTLEVKLPGLTAPCLSPP